MEWGNYENCIAVIALHKVGMPLPRIFATLKPLKQFVYHTIQRFSETGSVNDRHRSGRPRTVRTPQAVKAVAARIRRNPVRTQSVMSREMSISRPTMSRVLNHDLGLRAYRQRTGHFLTAALCEHRVVNAKRLLKRYAGNGHRSMLFSD